jgi:phage baseplate assembly protein W
MTIYKGFSTVNNSKKYRLTDFDLAKQDLINHLHIRQGEKLMNPKFGTIIWNLLFEQLTPDVKKAMSDDLLRVAAYDPRLNINEITIIEYEHGIQIALDLTFSETNQSDQMLLNFERDAVK